MFRFKLQSVLDYRLSLEEKAIREFSELTQSLEEKKNVLQELVARRGILIGDLRRSSGALCRAEDIAECVAYVERIRMQEKRTLEEIRQGEEALDEKRRELAEAVKNRKVIEKMREKQEREYYSDLNTREQKHADELSVLKHGRRRGR
ncbi:MAG: flagellar export protein FliJ [Deltaproteobacteria bacterium]|jgi:flagellar FliJ protein|nr:flagellar export protein FliJ [Syntrophaceae bacterium]